MAKKTGTDEQLLTMLELATYLHLDEGTVNRLVMSGKIPGIQLDRQWRFQRAVIDQWIADQLVGDDESFADVPDGMKLPLEDLLPDQAIIPRLRARTPIAVIEELAARAYANGWLADKPWFVGAVVERESLASTAMEGGVAFLHTRAKDKGKIARPFMVVGRSWEGIAFGAPDGNPTYLFFLLGLKYDRLHLPILGRLARALRNPSIIAKLRSLSSSDLVRAMLLKEDAQVRAGLVPEIANAEAFKPRLDRQLRLRALRRMVQQKKTDVIEEEKRAAQAAKPSRAKAAAAKAAAAKLAAAAAAAAAGGAPVAAKGAVVAKAGAKVADGKTSPAKSAPAATAPPPPAVKARKPAAPKK
jgi:PTS system nitrogen regulatory IIA component